MTDRNDGDASSNQAAAMEQVVRRLDEMNERLGRIVQATESRDAINQAKGILVERYGISLEEAFALLTTASKNSNIKLDLVAAALVTNGQLPPSATAGSRDDPRPTPYWPPGL